jgi:hypothetical protein
MTGFTIDVMSAKGLSDEPHVLVGRDITRGDVCEGA